MLGSLPKSLEINGRSYRIEADYRNILCIMEAYSDKSLEDRDKVYVCLRRIYGKDFYEIPSEDYEEAIREANQFIDHGESDGRPSPRVVNWEKDERLIFPAINKIAGMEIRELDYLHWWTFLGYFQNIDPEGLWGTVLTLRQKKAKGKSFEKHEREFWNANALLCAIDKPKTVLSARERADSIFDELMKEKKGG